MLPNAPVIYIDWIAYLNIENIARLGRSIVVADKKLKEKWYIDYANLD